ncbi:Retrovirus-related Pol polyprotein from transposon gypsy [Dictyocoela muelleri]|nr:Retrovirus-related Pol polyprotein from transposon gypsy [Dictyocoela muelleri]
MINSLNGYKYFTLLDMKDGVFQIPLCEADREKATFLDASYRLMRYTKMPQSYKNRAAIFQRGMSIILDEFIDKICLLYIDDILIFSKNKEENDSNSKILKEILNT